MTTVVFFPDLVHRERVVGMDEYVNQLMDPPAQSEDDGEVPCSLHARCALPRPVVHAIVQMVHDWLLGVVANADRRRVSAVSAVRTAVRTAAALLPPTVARGLQSLRERERWVPTTTTTTTTTDGLDCLAAAVIRGMGRITIRELPFRGKDRTRRANALWRQTYEGGHHHHHPKSLFRHVSFAPGLRSPSGKRIVGRLSV